MKTLLACLSFIALFATTSFAQSIEFKKKEINYGSIEKGADGVRTFIFKNTGAAPLVIESAKGSCGCTVPSHPKDPIMPQETAEIRVKYDTNRIGRFTKYVTITSNATNESSVRLKIFGEVLAEPAATPEPEQNLFGK